eukprot:CAMPEP_0197848192 /NCGR_PEP_ID=MMETSP1438-20131217/7974_1 /TAXON_ID=1461541 /ORGANISM="Pterosperma sp., Strain CCMP1384" /LENGTH=278 /DNA_ID=CAMNT_0043460331 /DNA_START=66 /DNA_END=899 /DNA_ORIENTATION=-
MERPIVSPELSYRIYNRLEGLFNAAHVTPHEPQTSPNTSTPQNVKRVRKIQHSKKSSPPQHKLNKRHKSKRFRMPESAVLKQVEDRLVEQYEQARASAIESKCPESVKLVLQDQLKVAHNEALDWHAKWAAKEKLWRDQERAEQQRARETEGRVREAIRVLREEKETNFRQHLGRVSGDVKDALQDQFFRSIESADYDSEDEEEDSECDELGYSGFRKADKLVAKDSLHDIVSAAYLREQESYDKEKLSRTSFHHILDSFDQHQREKELTARQSRNCW